MESEHDKAYETQIRSSGQGGIGMNENSKLPGGSTDSASCFCRESVLEDGFHIEECRAAAESGDPGAQGVLGDCYQYGWHVKKDRKSVV